MAGARCSKSRPEIVASAIYEKAGALLPSTGVLACSAQPLGPGSPEHRGSTLGGPGPSIIIRSKTPIFMLAKGIVGLSNAFRFAALPNGSRQPHVGDLANRIQ